MKTIKLQKLKLTAFKGIKSLEIDFSDETQIFGANGTGKTTIFDAITWLLFGKDSTDRKDFEIKTLDKEGNAIPKIDHEVEAILDVDGELIEVRRVYSEKWVKQRGAEVATFTGHETNFFWNGVPMKQLDFQREVNQICDEFIFKLITSPTAFNSLPWKERRNILIQIAGDVSNDELIGNNKAYAELVQKLAKYNSEDDYKKMLQASVKKAKEEIAVIPSRIDEVEKSKPESVNEKEISGQLDKLNSELQSVEEQIENSSKAYQVELDKINNHNKEVLRVKSIIDQIKYDVEIEARKNHQKGNEVLEQYQQDKQAKERELGKIERDLKDLEGYINTDERKIQNIKAEMDSKRAEWAKINAEECKDSTVCPSCEQDLPADKVDEIISNFKTNKEKKLSAITAYGKELKKDFDATEQRLAEAKEKFAELKNTLLEVQKELDKINLLIDNEKELSKGATQQDPKEVVLNLLQSHKEYQSKLNELETLENSKPSEPKIDNSELKEKRQEIRSQIDGLKAELLKVDQIKAANARIQELADREKELAQQIANVDKEIFTLEAFTKLKVDEIEKRVRGKFQMVSFRMFKEQINGGLEPTCETLIDGVPFTDANTASRINAGIDIINTLSEFYGVTAPIVVDNKESVSELIDTNSQLITLIVSPADGKLRFQQLEKQYQTA